LRTPRGAQISVLLFPLRVTHRNMDACTREGVLKLAVQPTKKELEKRIRGI